MNDQYSTWDAAYVLGALSDADRHEFEGHLSSCPACQGAVGELAGMPGLLAQSSLEEVESISESLGLAANVFIPRSISLGSRTPIGVSSTPNDSAADWIAANCELKQALPFWITRSLLPLCHWPRV